jgi:hypothetical protein
MRVRPDLQFPVRATDYVLATTPQQFQQASPRLEKPAAGDVTYSVRDRQCLKPFPVLRAGPTQGLCLDGLAFKEAVCLLVSSSELIEGRSHLTKFIASHHRQPARQVHRLRYLAGLPAKIFNLAPQNRMSQHRHRGKNATTSQQKDLRQGNHASGHVESPSGQWTQREGRKDQAGNAKETAESVGENHSSLLGGRSPEGGRQLAFRTKSFMCMRLAVGSSRFRDLATPAEFLILFRKVQLEPEGHGDFSAKAGCTN